MDYLTVLPPGPPSILDYVRSTDVFYVCEPLGMRAMEASGPPKGLPKNYLMAWLLVMLKDRNLHGYEIMKALRSKFDVISEPGTVYRALRQLERDGFISSWWDPKEQGPVRRVYTLTEQGHDALVLWSEALEQYRSNLDAFFTMYSGVCETGVISAS